MMIFFNDLPPVRKGCERMVDGYGRVYDIDMNKLKAYPVAADTAFPPTVSVPNRKQPSEPPIRISDEQHAKNEQAIEFLVYLLNRPGGQDGAMADLPKFTTDTAEHNCRTVEPAADTGRCDSHADTEGTRGIKQSAPRERE